MIRIDVLPDDVLLQIFDFYVDKNLIEAWHMLVHVCRRWRSLVFESPRRLNLRLFCTRKTPARNMLNVWPALPLFISGHITLSSCVDNIIAALEQSNRVCHVDLWGLEWKLDKVLAAMQVPFPELTHLSLASGGLTPPVTPDLFLGGSAPRLQHFWLLAIPFPGLPKLLLSATHLVYLSLRHIPRSGYISPEAMVALPSALSSLETLILRLLFQYSQSRPDWESLHPPASKHSVMPALEYFDFQGVIEYFEDLITFIDAPQLDDLRISFINLIDFDCPRLSGHLLYLCCGAKPKNEEGIWEVTLMALLGPLCEFQLHPIHQPYTNTRGLRCTCGILW